MRQKKRMLECGLSNLVYLLEGSPTVLRGKVNNYEDTVEILETVRLSYAIVKMIRITVL
jgi:hypothetical protein